MPKIVDHNRYRQELLNQCLALFAEQGYGAITMRQIAQRLNVSTGTLYHYFPSKESILTQLVQELCEQSIMDFLAQAPVDAAGRDRLRRVTIFFLENYSFYQQQALLWVEFHQHSQRQSATQPHFLQGFWQRTHEQLAAYLQLPPEQVDFILVFMDGLLLQCLYDRGNHERDWVAQQLEYLIRVIEGWDSG
jgi:AcrR family transcriptional regulator